MLLFGIDYGSGYGLTEENTQPLYFDIGEGEHYTGSDLVIEADWSSAGYLLAAAAIAQSGPAQKPEGYRIRGMNFSSHQADRMIMRLLLVGNDNINFIDTHATCRTFDGTSQAVQEICDLVVIPSAPLRPIVCNATDAPDAIPTLAVLALFAQGESRIAGLGRLTNKESDRRGALIAELLALGADIDIEGDELVVRGGNPLRGASLCAHNDHRMAMALAVATLFIEEPCTLDSLDCVAKSWPSFWEVFGLNK
jgi:3-phosphoshikimate 1-carboxyvinyltransferase